MYTKKKYLILIIFLVILPIISSSSKISLSRDNVWSINLSGVFYSSLALGDIDNDGDYDMISMGCITGGFTDCTIADKIRVYMNNGTTFKEDLSWETNTTNLGYGSLSLGDIDNDGDLDFVAMGDQGGEKGIVKIFTNNGTTFNEALTWGVNFSMVNAFNGAIGLGDVDNNGKLDLVLAGAYPSNNNGIYINNGTSFVRNSNWLESLPLVGYGGGGAALIFADYNLDGYLDLVFTGSRNTDFYTAVYINNGSSLIENSSYKGDFTETFGFPSLSIGDYNNDGFIDLATIGARAGDHLKFYNNTGSSFSLQMENNGENSLAGYLEGSIAFGDYDNDGDLDFAAMGRESGRNKIYTNNYSIFEGDIFEQQDMHDDNMEWGGLTWIDVNNDTNLDLIINGYNPSNGSLNFKVYLSNASLTKNNTKPNPPNSSFSSSYVDGVINLSWGNGSDVETNTSGLYYNLMIGNETTNHTIVSGVYGGSSNPTAGYFGNMMQRKSISLMDNYLSSGTYYWYVQTIDTGLQKSDWSEGQSIVIGGDTTAPSISSISSSVTSSTATITWVTDETSNSSIYYGTTATNSHQGSSDLTTSHSVTLSSLSASTLYYYNVSSCDYWKNCNISIQYNFTTSEAPVTPPGGGGSSGTSTTSGSPIVTTWTKTYSINKEQFNQGYTQILKSNERVSVPINEETHYIGVKSLTNDTATIGISSDEIIVILSVGEESKVNVNNDNFYDVYVKLDLITNNTAKIIVKELNEEIPTEKEAIPKTDQEKTEKEEETKLKDILRKYWIYEVVALVVVFLIVMTFKFLKNHKKHKEWRKYSLIDW